MSRGHRLRLLRSHALAVAAFAVGQQGLENVGAGGGDAVHTTVSTVRILLAPPALQERES